MKRKARPRAWLLLVVAADILTMSVVAAGDRFVPDDPGFVVANVQQAAPDADLRRRMAAWQQDPTGAAAAHLATAYLERARAQREPMFFGRAEAVLERAVRAPGATHEQQRLYAETLQFRHDFTAAERLLDGVLAEDPRDAAARTLRASVRLVRGDFTGARADCAQLIAAAGEAAPIGAACLAESLAGGGDLARARALLHAYPAAATDPGTHAYLLSVRAELGERAGANAEAIADYAQALALRPVDDSIRAALADALAAHGDLERARATLRIERPSLALLVRQVALSQGTERVQLHARAESWLALERGRGDSAHNREAAMLASAAANPVAALAAARANFANQREMADVRLLARTATSARSGADLRALRAWLDTTGFADAVTESILAGAARR